MAEEFSWGALFARHVARELERDPHRNLEEAKRRAEERLTQFGFSPSLLALAREEFQALMKQDPPVFQRRYVLNPLYLSRKLGKRTFIYLVDGRDGRYPFLRHFLRHQGGEHSRFILFGPQDVMIIIYGTEEESEEFLGELNEQGWPVDAIRVEAISRWHGVPLPAWQDIPLDPETLEAMTRLLQGKETPELEPTRQQLQEAGILLGPVVVEDLKRTGRVRAFVGIRLIGGPFPMVMEQFEQALLRSKYQTAVRSIYRCGVPSHYHLLLELLCEDVGEVDRVTEWMQEPMEATFGATFRVETTTFIVAETEVETFPTLLLAPARQEPLEQDLALRWDRQDLIRAFRALPEIWQLFLRQAREEYQQAASTVPSRHREGLEHAWRTFAMGVLEQDPPALQNAFLEAARILEEILREALRRIVEWVYGQEYGQGQRELGLPHSRFNQLSLGQILTALEKADQSPVYRALGLELPRPVMRMLRFVHDLRNEMTHHPVSAGMEEAEWRVFARQIWDGIHYILGVLGWCQTQILDRRVVLIDQVPKLLRITRDPQMAQWPLAAESEIQGLIARLEEMREGIRDVQGRIEELARLPVLSSPSSQEHFWQERLGQLLQKQEEIMGYLRPERRKAAESLLQSLREAGTSVGLNLIANALWSLLAWASPDRLPELLRWLTGG